jgi:hypothetical protein
MASVLRETLIEASTDEVWAVIGDFANGPTRMAPGFVTETRLEAPDIRVVTFISGDIAHERLIGIDNQARRIVWELTGGWAHPTHNNAAMHVIADGENRSQLVWTHDVLPDELAAPLAAAMDSGLRVIKAALATSGVNVQ